MGLMFAFLLVGCSGKPSESKVETQLRADIYYPLNPQTRTYQYTVKSSEGYTIKTNGKMVISVRQSQILDDVEVMPVVTMDPEDRQPLTNYVHETPDGIYLIATQNDDLPLKKLDPKLPILKTPIKEGVLFEPSPMDHLRIGSESVEEINAIITVPYGRFNKCIRKRFINRDLMSGEVFFERTDWYAPNVGLVRRITRQQVGPRGKASIIETQMVLQKVD